MIPKDLEGANIVDPSPGICLAIDFSMGAVLDMLNGSGNIAYIDESKLIPGNTVEISIAFTKQGSTYIPNVWVGEDHFLHPALLLANIEQFDFVAGREIVSQAEIAPRPGTSPELGYEGYDDESEGVVLS